jgi:hypothetical protein
MTIIHTQPEPFFETAFQRSDLARRRPRPEVREKLARQASNATVYSVSLERAAGQVRRAPGSDRVPDVRLAPWQ